MSDQKFIMLNNVRISFPDLFQRAVVNGEQGSYGATFLLDAKEHAGEIKQINGETETLIKTNLKGSKVPSDKRCLKDGDDMTRPEYEGHMVVSANSKDKPHVFKPGTQQKAETEDESGIYSGCYVDAKISLWAQNNNYGKRINAQLVAVRFAGEGEAFSSGHVTETQAADGFEVADNDAFFDEAA